MNTILVHPTELHQISEQLYSSAKKIGVALQAIDNDILSLKGDKFLGNRANAFQANYAPKRDALLKAKEIVSHFAEDLQTAARRFEQADKNKDDISLPLPMPIPTPTPSQVTPSLPSNWNEICGVAKPDKGITPELIAAVLEYERTHRDAVDDIADLEGKLIMWYEGKLEDTEVFLLNKTLSVFGESFITISFGAAQMNPDAVIHLVEGGYIPKPENWDTDQRDVILRLLLDEKKAPELVSARLEQIYDHWMSGGVDISKRPDVLGNLYSIGLEGEKGVHADLPDNQGDRGEDIEKRVLDLQSLQNVF